LASVGRLKWQNLAKKMTNQVRETGVELLSQKTLHPMETHGSNLQATH